MKPLAIDASYRNDARVPAFPDKMALFVYDGECVICSGFVRWLMARDHRGRINVTPAQGAIGQGLYAHLGIPPDHFDTHLLVVDDTVLGRSDAAIGLLRQLGGGWSALASLADAVPLALRDAAYDWLARNRYRVRGRRNSCWRPDPALAARVL
jgi:predicted DCC family thiol-disulfide oxidoreductase YuxK